MIKALSRITKQDKERMKIPKSVQQVIPAKRIYGRDGVMGALEPTREITSHEIGIVIDAVADTQEHASAVCSVARSTLLHYGYPGRIATAGNLAFPFSPSDIKVGPVYIFNVYGLLRTEDPVSLFKRTYEMIGG